MGQLPTTVIGDAYRGSIAWETLTELVDVENRMAGQAGERAAAELIAERFGEHLRDVETVEFGIPSWWRGSSALELERATRRNRTQRYDGSHQLVALPGSPAGVERGPLIDVGYGRPADFEASADELDGAIAMTSTATPEEYGRWIHRQEKYDAAVEAGAAGFVFRNHIEGTLPPTGAIGDTEGPGAIPAVGVSKELGDRLVRHCEGGDPVTAELAVEARTEPTTSRNVTGVTGPETGEQILVTAHHDAHDIAEGANDNGAGSALVAEVGRLLSQIELGTTVRCVTFGAEEVGLLGSEEMAATADRDRIRAVVNLDGIGESRDLRVATHGFDAVGEAFETLGPELTAGVTVDDGLVPHSDHWPFVKRGVPGAMVSSDSGADRGWGHTHADTLDKLDRRDFREIAVVVAAAVARLAEPDRTTEYASPETIAERAADREDIEIDVGTNE